MGSGRSEEDKQREREGGTAVDARARQQRAVSFCVYGSGRRARAVSEVGCWLACLSWWSLREIASAGRCFWSASSRLEMPTTGELWQGNRDPDTRLALAPSSHSGDGRRCSSGVGGPPPETDPNGARYPAPHPDIGGGSVRYTLQQRPPPRTPNWRSGSASPTGGGRTDAPYRRAWAHANGRASFARAEPSQRRGSWLEWEV